MTEISIGLLVLGVIAVGCYFFIFKPKKAAAEKKFNNRTVFDRVTTLAKTHVTPKGVQVRVEANSKSFVNADALIAIDDGIDKGMMIAAKCRNHATPLKHSDIIIAVLDAEIAPESKLPAYRIPPGQYAGTEFDMGGYILAAGQMVAIGEPHGNILAVPAPVTKDYSYLAAGVYHEYEHLEDAWFDTDNYHLHETHGGGKGHPLWENCLPQVGFKSNTPKPFLCGNLESEY